MVAILIVMLAGRGRAHFFGRHDIGADPRVGIPAFLGLDACDSKILSSEPDEVWCLQEAQITCVVTGTDDWRWTAYGFVNSKANGLLNELPAQYMRFDQIAG